MLPSFSFSFSFVVPGFLCDHEMWELHDGVSSNFKNESDGNCGGEGVCVRTGPHHRSVAGWTISGDDKVAHVGACHARSDSAACCSIMPSLILSVSRKAKISKV